MGYHFMGFVKWSEKLENLWKLVENFSSRVCWKKKIDGHIVIDENVQGSKKIAVYENQDYEDWEIVKLTNRCLWESIFWELRNCEINKSLFMRIKIMRIEKLWN